MYSTDLDCLCLVPLPPPPLHLCLELLLEDHDLLLESLLVDSCLLLNLLDLLVVSSTVVLLRLLEVSDLVLLVSDLVVEVGDLPLCLDPLPPLPVEVLCVSGPSCSLAGVVVRLERDRAGDLLLGRLGLRELDLQRRLRGLERGD